MPILAGLNRNVEPVAEDKGQQTVELTRHDIGISGGDMEALMREAASFCGPSGSLELNGRITCLLLN